MKRYCVERVIGDDEFVLGVYDDKEKMLKEKERFKAKFSGQPGVVCGICADMDEQGNRIQNSGCRVFEAPFRVF